MSRTAVRLLAAATVLAVACTDPTEVCSCSIPLPSAVVTGRVIDGADAPVVGARVAFDGVLATMSSEPAFLLPGDPAVTDAAGHFITRAFGHAASGELALRALVVRAGSTDTVRLRTGATARFGSSVPDTVDVTLALP